MNAETDNTTAETPWDTPESKQVHPSIVWGALDFFDNEEGLDIAEAHLVGDNLQNIGRMLDELGTQFIEGVEKKDLIKCMGTVATMKHFEATLPDLMALYYKVALEKLPTDSFFDGFYFDNEVKRLLKLHRDSRPASSASPNTTSAILLNNVSDTEHVDALQEDYERYPELWLGDDYDGSFKGIGERLRKVSVMFDSTGSQFIEANDSSNDESDLSKCDAAVMELKRLRGLIPRLLATYHDELTLGSSDKKGN